MRALTQERENRVDQETPQTTDDLAHELESLRRQKEEAEVCNDAPNMHQHFHTLQKSDRTCLQTHGREHPFFNPLI